MNERARRCPAHLVVAAGVLAAGALAATPLGHAAASSPAEPRGSGNPVVTEDAGDVLIVDPAQRTEIIDGGGSAVQFSFRLPQGAVCPGDSANDQWRVNGFLIPADAELSSYKFALAAPNRPAPLYAVAGGRVYSDVLMEDNLVVGLPGLIPVTPALTFGYLSPGDLPAGRYRIGIACAYDTIAGPYWDAEISVSDAPADEPARFEWVVIAAGDAASPAYPATGDDGVSVGLVVAAFAVAAAIAAAIAGRMRLARSRQPANAPVDDTQADDPRARSQV